MVKNIPAIERSTEIRFGKHVPDSTDQADNTIVFNASNVLVPTPYSNAVYLSPIRNRPDFSAPEVVLLMYDRNTKEITESGESANALVGGVTFALTVDRANVTSNTVQFTGGGHDDNNTGFVTDSNVGISNLLPQHTVSVGSNLYIDEFGSNVLVVSGNVAVLRDMVIDGNLRVNGDTTVIYADNTAIKDAFIELGQNNTSEDTTLDLGVLMHRPDALSNVVIGYREGSDEFAIGYTDAKPTDKIFTPKTDEDINVHVYGLTHVDANIYAHEDLVVDGNVYVSQNVSVTEELTVSGNVYADKDLEVVGNTYVDGNVVASQDFTLSGNAYVSGNIVASQDLTMSGNAYVSGNVYADRDLEVAGNVYADGNVVAYQDVLVTGNVYVSTNVSVTKELTVTGNVYADKDLEVVGNTYVSGNVEVTKDLIVTGNTHLEGPNVFITHTMDFLDPTTAIVTDLNSNVEVKLNQLANVVIGTKALANEDMLVYDGSNWTNQLQNHTFLHAKAEEVIAKGDAVYATGTIGNNTFSIRKAQSNSSATMPALGLAYQAFTLNQEGLIVTFGRSDGINTDNFQTGETVYVSNVTAGALSNVKPYGATDLIQNIGLVVKGHPNSGIVSVTGVGRSNDIPNAVIETSNASVNYVYVNSVNNDLRKIDPMKLPTKLQTLSQVVNTGNAVANAVTLRGLSITSGNGFNGDLTVTGNVSIDNDTLAVDSVSHRVGLKTTSPNSNLHVVGNVFVTSNITTSSNIFVVGEAAATSKTTGALQVTGGVGVQGDIHATHANLEDVEADSITVTDTTAATDKTSGALQVAGGVGIQGDLYATDTTLDSVKPLNMSIDTIPITDASKKLVNSLITQDNGAVIINANVEITGNISVVGNTFTVTSNDLVITDRIITIANNNPVHDLDIGIIMEHPDYNIGLIHHGSTHLGGAPGHHLSIGYINEAYDADSITWQSDEHITANIWGHLITQNTVTIEYNDVYIVGGGLGIGIGDREDGTPDANIHVVGNAFVTSNITTSSNVLITGDAAATSKTTGALQVAGGVGVQGDIYGVTVYTDDYLTHIDDTNTKIGFPANDTFTVTTNNAERIRVNSSGRVGIGTASPIAGSNLHVFGQTTTISSDTTGSSASPEVTLYRDQTGSNGNYLGQLRYTGQNDNSGDKLYGKITGKIKTATQGSENGVIETALITGGSQRISVRHSGDLFQIKNGTDFEVGEVANLYVHTATNSVGINTDSPAYNLDVRGTSNVGVFTTPDASVTDATTSSSKTTGALKVAGGVGIVGPLFGANANLEDVEADSVNVTDTTVATNKTSGALQVAGGVGVSGALFGANANLEDVEADSVNVTDTTVATNKTSGALQVAGGVGVSGALYGANANLEDVEADSVNVTDTTVATNKTSGALQVAGGVGVSGALYGAAATFDDLTVDGTTLTVDTGNNRVGIGMNNPGYALDVTGDFNVSGNIRIGGVPFSSSQWTTTGSDIYYTTGNVGIGTATPQYQLDVDGGTTEGAGDVMLRLMGAANKTGKLILGRSGNSDIRSHAIEVNNNSGGANNFMKFLVHDGGSSSPYETRTEVMTLLGSGNVGIGTVSPSAPLHVAGGTIINSDGVAKKTYSYTGDLSSGQTVANSTIKITFSAHVFYAKIVAHLVESDNEVSTFSLECGGGNWSGGTPLAIAKGPQAIFGSASTNPWSSTVTTSATTVSFKPTTNMAVAGHYNVFIEYISQSSSGVVSKITEGTTDVVTFGY
ncbi:hypothetical protein OLNG_00189 [Ostreococcus lucimarinus virus OlV5]|uniref:tail fiber protein n=1 Tax=Ostreococcus lucimarinus virus OlV5 TaxID=754064 RepID=UPI0002C09436|nr:tail fiber protein [Ostreococcus lucimarinus virus OlV5]AGH31260.1 hypothetical protein OLNG_00189 [Ostreococcus lucimarinus virus OlV5]